MLVPSSLSLSLSLSLALAAWVALAAPAVAGTAPVSCQPSQISVVARSPDEARRACDAASVADARLRDLGLTIAQPVVIEVTEGPDFRPGSCVAFYNTFDHSIQVLPADCLFDLPGRASTFPDMDPVILFDSLIQHGLVHADLDQHPEGHRLPGIAHEYLACAIQIDSVPVETRHRILDKAAITEPVRLERINEAVLNLSPLVFAVMAWHHFTDHGGDAALVRRVLEGEMIFNNL